MEEMKDLSVLSNYKEYAIYQVDRNTEKNISQGFTFNGLTFSLSITAQINWSNLFNIPNELFPLTISSKNDEIYSLALSDRQNFYLSALNTKNSALQSGTITKQQILACTNTDDIHTILSTLN